MKNMSQGESANRHGDANKMSILDMFLRAGFEYDNTKSVLKVENQAEFVIKRFRNSLTTRRGIIMTEVETCISVVLKPAKSDFIAYSEGWPAPLGLFSRTQTESGTAEEKLDRLYSNIRERYQFPCMVSLDGDGFSKGEHTRLDEICASSPLKICRAFHSNTEILRWLTEGAIYPSSGSSLFSI